MTEEEITLEEQAEEKEEAKSPSVLVDLVLGKAAIRFLRQTKSAHLFNMSDSLPRMNSCVRIFDDEGHHIGNATIEDKRDVDVRTLGVKEVVAAGHSSLLAMIVQWAVENDNEAYMEWADTHDVPPTRISSELREFLDSRPKKNYKARLVGMNFQPLQQETKSGG